MCPISVGVSVVNQSADRTGSGNYLVITSEIPSSNLRPVAVKGGESSPCSAPPSKEHRDRRRVHSLSDLERTSKSAVAVAAASDKSLPSTRQPQRHRVSFGEIQVRKYPIILGDHPDCSSGPPISIGWEYRSHKPMDIEEYESRKVAAQQQRPHECIRPRSPPEFAIPAFKRRNMIKTCTDRSNEEIRQAQDLVRKVQRQRQHTVNRLPLSKVEEIVESGRRKLKRLLGSGKDEKRRSQVSFKEERVMREDCAIGDEQGPSSTLSSSGDDDNDNGGERNITSARREKTR